MSGALKHFFDTIFLEAGGALAGDGSAGGRGGRPQAVRAVGARPLRHDRRGAFGAVDRAGARLAAARPPVLEVLGDVGGTSGRRRTSSAGRWRRCWASDRPGRRVPRPHERTDCPGPGLHPQALPRRVELGADRHPGAAGAGVLRRPGRGRPRGRPGCEVRRHHRRGRRRRLAGHPREDAGRRTSWSWRRRSGSASPPRCARWCSSGSTRRSARPTTRAGC